MGEMTIEDVRSLLMEDSGASADAQEGAVATQGGAASEVAEGEALPADAVRVDGSASAEEMQRAYVDGSVGLGIDIVEIARMEGILQRRPRFAEQVFSPAEQEYCNGTASPATHYALRFAAKEAVVKALGTGFAEGIWVHDIEVERTKKGRPVAKLSGRALEVANEQGVRDLSLSLSYTRTDAVACALAITDSSVRASEKRKDPMEELARQFKETRKMLDEL